MLNRILLMADAPAGGTPPTQVTPPSPNPQGATPEEHGSADMAADLMAELTGGKPADVTPPAEPANPASPKPAAAPAAPSKPTTIPSSPTAKPAAAPSKPAAPPAPVNADDPKLTAPELRKHLKQLQADLQQTRTEKQTTTQTLESRIAELNKKKFWSESDEKEFASKTQRLAQLEADLYGRDFTQSPEYKKQFTDKINGQFKDAVDVFASLQVKGPDDTTRPATHADVLRLFEAPNNAERRKMAKEMFGEDYQEALDMISPMVETRKAADQAVKDKTDNYQSESKQRATAQQEQTKQFNTFVEQQTATLAQQYPDVFTAPETEPEAQALLTKGFDFVKESVSKQNMDINERAARSAIIQSWAGAFPRLFTDNQQLRTQLAEALATIEKFHASDPSNGGEGGGGGDTSKDEGGSDDLAAEIDALDKK